MRSGTLCLEFLGVLTPHLGIMFPHLENEGSRYQEKQQPTIPRADLPPLETFPVRIPMAL